jgi:hypothetical protein
MKLVNSKDVNPDAVYFDYKIWGEEGKEDVTVMLQYRLVVKMEPPWY